MGSREWATSLLLRLGTQVKSVSDATVRAAAASEAAAALALYGTDGDVDADDPASSG